MKAVYRFSHSAGGRLYWQGPLIPGDSRSEQVSCNAAWFYGMMVKQS